MEESLNINQNHEANLLDNDVLLFNNSTSEPQPRIFISSNSTLSISAADEDDDIMLQSAVFIEDALYYKSIHHKTSKQSLSMYRWYFSNAVQRCIQVVITLLLLVGFFETPSSLSYSSDPRRNPHRFELPFGYTEGVEIVGLLVLLSSNVIQAFLTTGAHTPLLLWKRNRWLCIGFVVVFVSFVDIAVSLSLGPTSSYQVTIRRLLRPYFLAQNTTMLKKTLKAMWNTMPEIFSVLTLLGLHLYFFTVFGMLLFPKSGQYMNGTRVPGGELNSSESVEYFKDLGTGAMSLLVLLTTANNPDVMMPAYSENRLYALYFILFSLIGTFLIFNLLTAIIYNQFRGYFEGSMQSSFSRRCVAICAAFVSLLRRKTDNATTAAATNRTNTSSIGGDGDASVIPSLAVDMVQDMISYCNLTYEQREYVKHGLNTIRMQSTNGLMSQDKFIDLFINIDCKGSPDLVSMLNEPQWQNRPLKTIQAITNSRYFDIIGNLVVLLNAILMTVEIGIHYEEDFHEVFSRLNIINYIFMVYYVMEQSCKIVAKGKKYFVDWRCLYEGIISVALLAIESAQLIVYGGNTNVTPSLSLWDCARIINMLVLLRLLRIIPNFRPMALVTSVLLGIIQSLKSFAGIIIIIYYFFAVLGMMLFRDVIDPPANLPYPPLLAEQTSTVQPDVITYECGTYEQLQYWANNFNDMGASLVTLWDIMVVNNWGVFLNAYKKEVSTMSQLYFIVWWLISAVVCTNLFVALILDNFIAKWESTVQDEAPVRSTVQSLFKKKLKKPTELQIWKELGKHPDLLPYLAIPTQRNTNSAC